MKTMRGFALLCVSILLALPVASLEAGEFSAASRTFTFNYAVTLKDIPAGARRVRVWLPMAVSDEHQTVVFKGVNGPAHLREMRESPNGNHILYGEISNPQSSTATFNLEFEVTRKEFAKGDFAALQKAEGPEAALPRSFERYLKPDQLVPIDGRIKQLADENTHGKKGTIERAHALYDYVFQTVRYDKSGTGWGRGDSLWVCDAKHGNCTDFHSLFISLARAEGIPARFEIGFPISGGHDGTVPGYHCWAEFYANGIGWVPVDISEAWKDPKKHDYFFGSIDANRVQFSMGRDLVLQPKQTGDPVNFFIYPYVEVDGKKFDGLSKKFTFHENPPPAEAAALGR